MATVATVATLLQKRAIRTILRRMAKAPSTLPPKKEGAKPRPRKVPDDLPKCGLPARKRKPKAATVKEPLTVGAPGLFIPDTSGTGKVDGWDPVTEAAAAKASVLKKHGTKATVPIDPKPSVRVDMEPGPMGGKLKRKRKEPVPEVSSEPATAAPRTARDLLTRLRGPSVPMTPEIFDDICFLVSEGVPLREICRMPDMPSKSRFYEYLEDTTDEAAHAGRVARYARARALGLDEMAAETIEIVDDASNDYMERRREDGSIDIVLDREHIQRSKLRAEHRLKLLACWDPKRYGAQLKLADPNGDRLDRGSLSLNDLAIFIAKIAVAVQHDAEVQTDASGVLIEG